LRFENKPNLKQDRPQRRRPIWQMRIASPPFGTFVDLPNRNCGATARSPRPQRMGRPNSINHRHRIPSTDPGHVLAQRLSKELGMAHPIEHPRENAMLLEIVQVLKDERDYVTVASRIDEIERRYVDAAEGDERRALQQLAARHAFSAATELGASFGEVSARFHRISEIGFYSPSTEMTVLIEFAEACGSFGYREQGLQILDQARQRLPATGLKLQSEVLAVIERCRQRLVPATTGRRRPLAAENEDRGQGRYSDPGEPEAASAHGSAEFDHPREHRGLRTAPATVKPVHCDACNSLRLIVAFRATRLSSV
jgi:hypothetical protein